jgi:hypothetical protein
MRRVDCKDFAGVLHGSDCGAVDVAPKANRGGVIVAPGHLIVLDLGIGAFRKLAPDSSAIEVRRGNPAKALARTQAGGHPVLAASLPA